MKTSQLWKRRLPNKKIKLEQTNNQGVSPNQSGYYNVYPTVSIHEIVTTLSVLFTFYC